MIEFDRISQQVRFTKDCVDYINYMSDSAKLDDYYLMRSGDNIMNMVDVVSSIPRKDCPRDSVVGNKYYREVAEEKKLDAVRYFAWKHTKVQFRGKPPTLDVKKLMEAETRMSDRKIEKTVIEKSLSDRKIEKAVIEKSLIDKKRKRLQAINKRISNLLLKFYEDRIELGKRRLHRKLLRERAEAKKKQLEQVQEEKELNLLIFHIDNITY